MDNQVENPQPKPTFKDLVKANFTSNFLVLIGALVITGVFVYGYTTYLAWNNFNEAKRIAEEGQKQSQELEQKRVDPIAPWQTYRNEEYGFELRYPRGWIIKHDQFGDMLTTQHSITRKAVGFEIQSDEDMDRDVIIRDALIQFHSDLKNNYYKPSLSGTPYERPFECISPREYSDSRSSDPVFIKILGQDLQICAYEFSESRSYPEHLIVYISKDENSGIVFDGAYSKEIENRITVESFLETFSQILSTFRFIETQSMEEADVKKVADLASFRTAAEIYYEKYKMYPPAEGNTSESRWQSFSNAVSGEKIISAEMMMGSPYDYQADPSRQKAVFKAILESPDNEDVKLAIKVNNDVDGIVYGVNCNKPNYCLLIGE